jgi:hypothetical protein
MQDWQAAGEDLPPSKALTGLATPPRLVCALKAVLFSL